jgi:hypothetical protein
LVFRWYSRDGRYLPTRMWIFIQDIQEQWAEDHPDMKLECTCDLDLDDGGRRVSSTWSMSPQIVRIRGDSWNSCASSCFSTGHLRWPFLGSFLQRPDPSNITSRRFFESYPLNFSGTCSCGFLDKNVSP